MDPDRRCGSLVKGHDEGGAGDYTEVPRAGRVNITTQIVPFVVGALRIISKNISALSYALGYVGSEQVAALLM